MKGMFKLAVLSLVAVSASASYAQAQFVTLTDGGSMVRLVRDGANAGLADTWTIGQSQDQLAEQSYWFRVAGDDNERRVGTLGAPTVNQFGPNFAQFTWVGQSFDITIRYLLTGGVNSADLAEIVTISNRGTSTLNMSLFEYDDFDLNGAANDTVIFENSSTALQTDGGFSIRVGTTPIPTFKELGEFPNTLLKLSDLDVDDLGNGLNTFTGDATFAYQWNMGIGAGQSWQMSKNKILTVPEPGTIAALGLGAVALLRRRRKA